MPTIRTEAHVDVTPEKAWEVVGDLGGVHKWLGIIETCRLDGDTRVCGLAGGQGTLVEKILERDDAERRYRYTITEAPFEIASHEATFAVQPDGDGSRIVWEVTFEPAELQPMFEGSGAAGIEGIKEALGAS